MTTLAPSPAQTLPEPPVAKRVPKVEEIHGERRTDDYYWLRDKADPDVKTYLEAENAYTAAVMKPTEAFQQQLYEEMLARIQETDMGVPWRKGRFFYYSRTEQGKQYPIYCRKAGSLEAAEEVVLDVNALAEGKPFMAIGAFALSDDANLLAYTTDETGFRQYTLHVKDLRTGAPLPPTVERVTSVAWAKDDATLFYSVEDEGTKRSYRLFRHRLGSEAHELVYEEPDEAFNVGVGRTRSGGFLVLGAGSHTTSEFRVLPADEPDGAFRLVAPRLPEQEYDLDHRGDVFWIRTNDRGRNFRLVTAPVADPRRENWKELVPHRDDVMIEGVDLFKDHAVVFEREGGLTQLRVMDLHSGASHRIAFPEPAYSASPGQNEEWEQTVYRYVYESFITPRSVLDYDMDARTATLLKEQPVLGGYDRTRYAVERVHATAPDGVKVPISLVYGKDLVRDGRAPLYLSGYGAYGIPNWVTFTSNRFSLVDRGVVVAIAHVRGGGEMGKPWHDDGRMKKKRNTFTDFIAAAEHLLAEKYGSRERLVIQGGSAGGLLMGAVTEMRPDLFRAVVSKVPFVDVVNSMLDESLPLTVGEFEEWGNPKKKDEYDVIRGYCPYSNLGRRAYPAILITTSFNDSQVMYWEPAKYVAKLRTLKTDANPLLLKTNMAAGHGGASGRYDYLREVAFDYAFVLWQAGIDA
ncbi:MAG TPA: S9 family peptidase [Vicinamibacteria bacterium]|nr:S9 family peptidase [Vicinamibacteria bacterium]